VQVRNVGTIGGSVVHADPAADYPAALLALEAKVKLVSAEGEREMSLEDFLVDALTTALEPGEVLTEIQVPAENDGVRTSYRSITQPASGYSIVAAAVRLGVTDGKVSFVRAGLNGVSSKAYRARAVEQALEGKEASAESFRAAAGQAADGVEALSDLHATPEFRTHLAKVQLRRALEEAAGSAG